MRSIGLFCLLFCIACQKQSPELERSADKMAIAALIKAQEDDWNRGDIEAYMSGYWQSDSLRFASGANFYYGWQRTLERYKTAYPDKAAMGKLNFTVYDISQIAADHAIVFGKWELERESDHPNGLFTLLFRRFSSGWKIIADHTSSAH
ncbi:MAG: nuclear transport factor 2 family protein [Calditrichaeota bacterium]|nr:nuclear transport factor 2 family protein [Calditrichota bacterium]